MSMSQRLLLAFLACVCSTTLFAEVHVDVKINGVDKRLEENVRLFLSIEQQRTNPLMSEGRLQRLHKKAPQEIASALQPFGYYRPEIKSTLTQTSADHWQASYTIKQGPPLRIGQFDFTVIG